MLTWVLTGRKLSIRVKEHKGAVRRMDENSLRALHYLASGHEFDCATGFAIIGGSTSSAGTTKQASLYPQANQISVLGTVVNAGHASGGRDIKGLDRTYH